MTKETYCCAILFSQKRPIAVRACFYALACAYMHACKHIFASLFFNMYLHVFACMWCMYLLYVYGCVCVCASVCVNDATASRPQRSYFFSFLIVFGACVQKGRDGVTSAKVLAYGNDTVDGVAYYTIEYQSSSSRGDKHFISKVTIVDKKVVDPLPQHPLVNFYFCPHHCR